MSDMYADRSLVPEDPVTVGDRVFRFAYFNPGKALTIACVLVAGAPFLVGVLCGWLWFS